MEERLIDLIFEAFHLKMIKHEGWKMAGVDNPDSVAEHSLSAAQIGYVLAKLEGADANKVAAMLVWHDMPESRIGDLHTVATNYIRNKQEIEFEILDDQLDGLQFEGELRNLFEDYEFQNTREGVIAKDADKLELIFQGKIYNERGYKHTDRWFENIGEALKTESAQKIFDKLNNNEKTFGDWRKREDGKGKYGKK